jgi:hypothetical protein
VSYESVRSRVPFLQKQVAIDYGSSHCRLAGEMPRIEREISQYRCLNFKVHQHFSCSRHSGWQGRQMHWQRRAGRPRKTAVVAGTDGAKVTDSHTTRNQATQFSGEDSATSADNRIGRSESQRRPRTRRRRWSHGVPGKRSMTPITARRKTGGIGRITTLGKITSRNKGRDVFGGMNTAIRRITIRGETIGLKRTVQWRKIRDLRKPLEIPLRCAKAIQTRRARQTVRRTGQSLLTETERKDRIPKLPLAKEDNKAQ